MQPILLDVLNHAFTFDSENYFTSIFPLTGSGLANFTPLTNAECVGAGAASACLGFTTVEGQDTTVRFAAILTSQPIGVPEPSALLLLGSGLIALVAFGWRRNRKG